MGSEIAASEEGPRISITFATDAEPTDPNLLALVVALKRAAYKISGGTYYSIMVEDRPDLSAVSYGGEWLKAMAEESEGT